MSTTIKLNDSSKAEIENILDSVVLSNSSPDDISISGKFIRQGKNDKGGFYIIVKTKNDSLIKLTNPLYMTETEIGKLKKDSDNIYLTYSASNKTVKFLSTVNESAK